LAPWLHSGEGTLARYRGVTLLVGPGDELVTGQLLAAARAAAGNGADQPDHRLRQIATRLIAANGKAPALCAVGEVDGGVAALVHGAARVTVRTDRGALSLTGCATQAVVDGFVAGQVSLVEAELGTVEIGAVELGAVDIGAVELSVEQPGPVAVADSVAQLPAAPTTVEEVVAAVEGVMAAVEQALAGAPVELPPLGESMDSLLAMDAGSADLPVADALTAAAAELLANLPAETIESSAETIESSAEPAESSAETAESSAETVESSTEQPVVVAAVAEVDQATGAIRTGVAAVSGVRCRKGHFNDPNLPYCVVCGIGLTQAGRVIAQDERPVLGVLLLDDGRLLPLDRDHVLGRSPDLSDQVRRGEATAVALEDPLVSDVHAWVSLRGWEVSVTDVGSQHGTYVRDPGAPDWEPLHGGGQRTLQPGALIAVGARQLRFETYRK